jgi:hypothetical protein
MGFGSVAALAPYASWAPVVGNLAAIFGMRYLPKTSAAKKQAMAIGAGLALIDSVVQSFSVGRQYLGGHAVEPLQNLLPEGMGRYGAYERALGGSYVRALPGGIHEYVPDDGVGEYISESGMGEYVPDSGMGAFEIVGDQGDLGQQSFEVEEAMAGWGDNGILGGGGGIN